MNKQDIQEGLVNLYLRLNGYFTTGLIIHSSVKGKNETELDVVAVRFPFHNQGDRVIGCSEYLQIPTNKIDIIIGEVKSGEQRIQFNKSLRDNKNSIEKVVKWIGAFDHNEINKIIDDIHGKIKPKSIIKENGFDVINSGDYSIRPIIFCVDRPEARPNQKRFIYGQLMLDYIWECLRPESERASCSTTYDFNQWGRSLQPIITYFKDKNKKTVGTINDYYSYFNL